ncbi:hypothetical protein Br6_04871 [Rhodococcus sp. Br-6]|nr:hypothetical protein Br6_04871 [Rhodococcus sp. Br-6]
MEYTDLAGNNAHGELWSPGPKMGTVWVHGATGPVVVDTRSMTEVHYVHPDLGIPHPQGVTAAAKATLAACPASGYPRRYEPSNDIEAAAVAKAQLVLAERKAFDDDWFNRQNRRGQREPLSKAKWAAFVGELMVDFTVDTPDLFATAA